MKRYNGWYVFVVLVLLFAVSVGRIRAQSQALQQLKLDIEKLAQLKTMLGNMHSGYSILSNGYDNIRAQAQSGFNLHKHFIDQLSAVSPAVKNSSMIRTILSLQSQIREEYSGTLRSIRQTGVFTTKELNELTAAYERIIAQAAQDLDALVQVTTAGRMQMSEADRIFFLERLASDMEKQLVSLRTFTTGAKRTAAIRARLKKDNEQLRSQYGINQ